MLDFFITYIFQIDLKSNGGIEEKKKQKCHSSISAELFVGSIF